MDMSIRDLNAAQSRAMSTDFMDADTLVEIPTVRGGKAQEHFPWYKRGFGKTHDANTQRPSYIPLFLCLLITVVVRAYLVIHTQGFIDGDEALVGIQAQHILHGELPIYFYNQPYMGSLEAYIMAAIFAVAGSSVWTLRAEPILLSLVVICLTWKLASLLADSAQLPLHAKQWFMTIAAFLAAIPPLYDTVLELRMLGGYIETFILMLLLMIFAFQLTNRRAGGASRRELTWYWAAIGFIVGLGLWVNPLILYAVLAVGIWIIIDWIKALIQTRTLSMIRRDEGSPCSTAECEALDATASLQYWIENGVERGGGPLWTQSGGLCGPPPLHRQPRPGDDVGAPVLNTFLKTLLLPALASIPACILGLAPAIYWGAQNKWQNITYMLLLSGNLPLRPLVQQKYPTRIDIYFGLTHLYTTCVIPRILSGALPGEQIALNFLHTPTLVINAVCIVITASLVALSFSIPHPLLLAVRKLAALPLLFAISVSVVFCMTEAAASGLWSCQYDYAGRYATPLMLVIPFFVATVFVIVVLLETGAYRANQKSVSNDSLPMAVQNNPMQLHSSLYPAAVPPSYASSSVTSKTSYWKWVLGLLVVLLIVSAYLQMSLYAASDAGSMFQSSYCTTAPANNNAIIAYMEREHIHYAWANNWLAYPIVFKTHGSIIISDPLPLIRHIPILDRIPAYTQAVSKADRPSLLILVKQNDTNPSILQYLDKQKIRYNVARFPSQEGEDVLVITPLNQTVVPFEHLFLYMFRCIRDG